MTKPSFPLVPRLSSLLNAARLVKNPIPVVCETMEKMGSTYFFHMGGKTKGLISQDLEVIQHLLLKNHKNYNKSPLQSEVLASYIGLGLLTNNGASWLRQRRLIQPAFGRKNINALSALIEDEVHLVMRSELGNGGIINMSHYAAMLTFHIIARALFSDEVTQDEIVQMRHNVERVQQMIILQVRQPFKKWYFNFTGQIRKHKKLAADANSLVKRIASNRRKSGLRRQDILQFLLDTRYEDTGEPMDIDQLADELIILMVAGHETTAQTVVWTLFLLNQHPNINQRVVDHVDEVGRDYMRYFEPGSYLMATIKESMRLYPPAWVIDRMGIEDDVIQGCEIPKDTIIMSFIYGLHHNPKYWNNPEEFNPERFITSEKQEAYYPFGAGPRLCIGNHFAYLELIVSLVNLLTNYKLPNKPLEHPGLRPLITLQPAKDVIMKLERR